MYCEKKTQLSVDNSISKCKHLAVTSVCDSTDFLRSGFSRMTASKILKEQKMWIKNRAQEKGIRHFKGKAGLKLEGCYCNFLELEVWKFVGGSHLSWLSWDQKGQCTESK